MAGIAALGCAFAAAPAAALDVARTEDRILDPAAHARITYENTVNVASYQQDAVLSFGGYQYTAWYQNDGPGQGQATAVVARRELPSGEWESARLGYGLWSNDSHNTIALGVTPSDGRLHLAFPTHDGPIRYTRSVPGVAGEPQEHEWSSVLFERTKGELPGAPEAPQTWTYPQFETAGSDTFLTYRNGSTDNGRQTLLRYDDDPEGNWTFLGRFTHNAGGTYDGGFGGSTSRYGYIHGFTADPLSGDLAVTLSWREQGGAWCTGPLAVGNHDLGYAVSDDGGLTWDNNAGNPVATTTTGDTSGTITAFSPGIVVEPIGINKGLINQETQAYDSAGRLHVVTSRVPDEDISGDCVGDFYPERAANATPYHHWRDADGTWHTLQLPFRSGSAGRTKLAFDSEDNAYVVLPDARIAAASAASEWADWEIVFDDPEVGNVSETVIDRQRARTEDVLTVAYQEPPENVPTCRGGGSSPDCASAYRLASFDLGSDAADAPRETEPEAAPLPFEGSAEDATNLAFNLDGEGFPEAFADSSQSSFPPSNANDGQPGTFWVSAGTAEEPQGPSEESPIHVGVDLGESHALGEVTMVPRAQGSTVWGPRAYTVEVSADGEAWTEVAAESETPNTPPAAVTSEFETIEARYLRLRVTEAWGGFTDPAPNVQVAELEVRAGEVEPGVPELTLSVMPKKRQAKVGRKATFRATLSNAGEGPATAVKLCVRAPRRLATVKGKRCVTEEGLDPDEEMETNFKLMPTRKARGKKVDVTFTATADGLEAEEATATLAVRARR